MPAEKTVYFNGEFMPADQVGISITTGDSSTETPFLTQRVPSTAKLSGWTGTSTAFTTHCAIFASTWG